ncbi:S8 family serine peptidase [Micromonospora sp. WMMD1082]|uniref:S8 family serine peptidase n=1 Tax=Micromonospora sp. WMMD1082 TaxID=3016104 RepID=UPI002417F45A|nr:S8 family serine peptidase [Micromonospora sp. WMMD1082]MDG4795726.1 S8 family serine peptidase [Micromonospora sp. WMMD1082]
MSWPQGRMAPHLVWPLTGGRGTVVAVVDTGVSRVSPSLAGAVRSGRDVVTGGPATDDCLGRGTALAGIVAARPTPGTAMAGMAPESEVLPIRVVDPAGRVPPDALADGIRAAAAERATVILVGAGVPIDSAGLRAAVAEAVAADSLIVAVATTGDDGSEVSYPAAYPQVLAVTGVNVDGAPIAAGDPSQAGGRQGSVDLAAPAAGGYSIGPAGPGHYRVGGPAVAAAYVAGTAALVRSYHPGLGWSQVRDRLLATAEPPPARYAGALGAGTVDPYAAVSGVVARPSSPPTLRGAAVVLPGPPNTDPAIRIAGIAGSMLLAVAAATAAVALTLRSARRRRR